MDRRVLSRRHLVSLALLLGVLVSLASAGFGKTDGKAASPGESGRGMDEIHLKGGEVVTGTLLDVDDERVVLTVGEGRRVIARAEVTRVQRAASAKRIRFVEKKHAQLLASGEATAADWRKLAGYCRKQHLIVERRRALREWLKQEPDATRIRLELGQARLAGDWLDEESVARKVEAGYQLSDGQLVKGSGAAEGTPKTAVSKESPFPETYRIVAGAEVTKSQQARIEKERLKRIRDAEKFLAKKKEEYEGVPWTERHTVRTRNFEIQCNSTRRLTRQYGELMELIRAKLAEMFPSRLLRNQRAPVFIFANQEDFMRHDPMGKWAGHGLGGYYLPASQKIVAFHGTFGFTGTTFGVLCHEGTHYYQGLVLQKMDNIPVWFIEGLAVYFGDGSSFDPKKRKIEVGGIPRDRLATLQERIENERNTDLEKLVVLTRRRGFSGAHYADAWGLIYFLVHHGKDGQRMLQEYWALGSVRKLTKRDFVDLAKKYFGSLDDLQQQYEKYVLALQPPPAGRIRGEYFESDYFQFDLKSPGPQWQFFEDRADRKMLIGLLRPEAEAEIRVYYRNNELLKKPEEYLRDYMQVLQRRHEKVEETKTTMGGVQAHKITYTQKEKDKNLDLLFDLRAVVEALKEGDVVALPQPGEKEEPPELPKAVTEFKLIQKDGVVSIQCLAPVDGAEALLGDFDAVRRSFTLTLTRRW